MPFTQKYLKHNTDPTKQTVRATMIMLVLTALAPIAGVFAQDLVVFQTAILALLLGWFGGVLL